MPVIELENVTPGQDHGKKHVFDLLAAMHFPLKRDEDKRDAYALHLSRQIIEQSEDDDGLKAAADELMSDPRFVRRLVTGPSLSPGELAARGQAGTRAGMALYFLLQCKRDRPEWASLDSVLGAMHHYAATTGVDFPSHREALKEWVEFHTVAHFWRAEWMRQQNPKLQPFFIEYAESLRLQGEAARLLDRRTVWRTQSDSWPIIEPSEMQTAMDSAFKDYFREQQTTLDSIAAASASGEPQSAEIVPSIQGKPPHELQLQILQYLKGESRPYKCTMDDLESYLDKARSTVDRHLQPLKEEGLVRTSKQWGYYHRDFPPTKNPYK